MTEQKAYILLINGPELGRLGEREPEIYGKFTLKEIEESVRSRAHGHGYDTVCFQSDFEDALAKTLKAHAESASGIVINPAILTHFSVVLKNCLTGIACPKIEVHLTNVYKREEFRHESITAGACDGVVMGFGMDGYVAAVDMVMQAIKRRSF